MRALRKIHQALVPGGVLLDMHPIPPPTRAEVGGRSLGEFDDAEFWEIVVATEAPLEATDLFALEGEIEFDWLERYDSGAELLEDLKSWESLRVPRALATRIRKAEPPVDLWERVVLRSYRARR